MSKTIVEKNQAGKGKHGFASSTRLFSFQSWLVAIEETLGHPYLPYFSLSAAMNSANLGSEGRIKLSNSLKSSALILTSQPSP